MGAWLQRMPPSLCSPHLIPSLVPMPMYSSSEVTCRTHDFGVGAACRLLLVPTTASGSDGVMDPGGGVTPQPAAAVAGPAPLECDRSAQLPSPRPAVGTILRSNSCSTLPPGEQGVQPDGACCAQQPSDPSLARLDGPCWAQLPACCIEHIISQLPPNCLLLAARCLSRAYRDKYAHHRSAATVLACNYLPPWALERIYSQLAALGDASGERRHALGRLLTSVAASGSLENVAWLHKGQGVPLSVGVCAAAARGGHLPVLVWLREQGALWTASATAAAARGAHLHVLCWLHAQGCPLSASSCCEAARAGSIETLQWLRQHGAAWDKYTCIQAAERGHLEVLMWLRAQAPPCPWDPEVLTVARRRGHRGVVAWASANGLDPAALHSQLRAKESFDVDDLITYFHLAGDPSSWK